MIIKDFEIKDLDLKYKVGISQIKFDYQELLTLLEITKDDKILNQIITKIESIQEKYEDTVIQLISDTYLLNQEHIYSACYFLLRAFKKEVNISSSKNLELLLYLGTQRQIKSALDLFGINIELLKAGIITICIINNSNNIMNILGDILKLFNGKEVETMNINQQSELKLKKIKNLFKINDEQLKVVSTLYKHRNLTTSFLALHELICEKMALLSLEKNKGR
ncbi:MAG: KEOPS complex subunit Cgi121 [Promethearchaeota archaeon]